MDTQNIINVDIDSRAVTLPSNFNLGVMNDNSCKTITFMFQKKIRHYRFNRLGI